MTTKETIGYLCKKKGISVTTLEKELGFGNGSINKSYDNIRSDRLLQIAKYFNVSADYLLTGKEFEFPVFEPRQLEVIKMYSDMSEEQKNAILVIMRSMLS